MTMSSPRVIAGLLLISPMAAAASAQGPSQNLTLTTPISQSADAFTSITSVRELSNGRVIVTDVMDKSVHLIDLASETSAPIGREGQGPGEYGFPTDLLALPGDTTLLVDRVNRRFLIILPSGKTGQSIPFPVEAGRDLSDPRAVDRDGRIFFQGSLLGGALTPGQPTPDSLPIIRWDRRRNSVDTVTYLKVPSMNMNVSGSGSTARVMMFRQQPFGQQDDWSVTPDGRTGVARVADYHIEWFSPTRQRTAGPVNRFERLRVTEADKEAQRKQNARAPRMMISTRGGSTRTTAGPPPAMPTGMQEPDYPEFKPPFPTRAVYATPEGMLWVLRSRPATDLIPTFDVFDQRGMVVGKVTLPRDRRLVGFGNGTVYLARTDGDDLQWLEKYRR
ncbi:MAG: hypothetical protein ABI613_11605 [Gemmatimonadota bacterium]